jgi:hypothetical protein
MRYHPSAASDPGCLQSFVPPAETQIPGFAWKNDIFDEQRKERGGSRAFMSV